MKTLFRGIVLACVATASLHAQNLLDRSPVSAVIAPDHSITPGWVLEIWARTYDMLDPEDADTPEAHRIAAKLEAHVRELIAGWPWRPLHHVLGISGSEVYFAHPADLFHALSLALPFLTEPTRKAAGEFLAMRLSELPPYSIESGDLSEGHAREAYDVPEALRRKGRIEAASAIGIAAFAEYHIYAGRWCKEVPIAPHWAALCKRAEPLLAGDYSFDPARRDYTHDEAERLNGDRAGLIAFARLADWQGDRAAFERTLPRIAQLTELRINLERINPRIVEPTQTSSKSLHNFKLARYGALNADVGFTGEEQALARSRLRAFRAERNGWWIALGDRTLGGENYTNPLHVSHALFLGAALIERLPAAQLEAWIDIPSCKADLYFIERCALALGAGR